MRRRCYHKEWPAFKWYGARGIKVCERWLNSFENFLADMGHRPSKRHSIDRINTNGDYEPSNCRWATPVEQQRNRRDCKRWSVNGTTYETCKQAAKSIGISAKTLYNRMRRGYPGYSMTPLYPESAS